MIMLKELREYRFKSPANGSVEYVGIDDEQGIWWTDYYADNGGHRPCEEVRRKDVRARAAEAEALGYLKVPGRHMWHLMRYAGGGRENHIMDNAVAVTRFCDGGHLLVNVESDARTCCTWCVDQRRWVG